MLKFVTIINNKQCKMNNKQHFNFLIAAGGTGGHLFPALAVVERLTEQSNSKNKFWFVGSQHRLESKMIPDMGYPYSAMPITGFTGMSLKTLLLPFKIFKSVNICRSIIKTNKIDAVICTGAYISYPAGLAASKEKIPLFLLESNVNPGKAISMLSKHASLIFTSFEETKSLFNEKVKDKIVYTGNPLRKQFYKDCSVIEAKRSFGLNPDKSVLLVFGGSLGAMSINRAIENYIDSFANSEFQVLWQTGSKYSYNRKLPDNIKQTGFIDDMAAAYIAADLVVSRSGATSTAEICQMAKPSVLIPLPSASNNEQEWNAKALMSSGASVLLNDADAMERLFDIVTTLMSDKDKLQDMSNSAGKLAKPQAANECVDSILRFLSNTISNSR